MRAILAASALSFSLSFAASASGPICGDRDAIVTDLEVNHGETAQSVGLSTVGQLLEIYASLQGTWTALLSTPEGTACIVAYGAAWEYLVEPPAGA
jgi:hypothetical protein